jgi:pilus assembly protein CpaC
MGWAIRASGERGQMKLLSTSRMGACLLFAAIALAVPSSAAEMQGGAQGTPIEIAIQSGRGSEQITVAAGKSQLVRFDRAFRKIVVGDKDIAEVVPLSSTSVYVLGKKRGVTNLAILDGGGQVIAAVDVAVTYDIDGLRRQIARLVPGEDIDISPAGDALVLSGKVGSAGDLHTIDAIAERYAPDAVTNLLQLGGSQQVLLEVKFAEVQRSAVQNLGLSVVNGVGVNKSGLVPVLPPVDAGGFGSLGGLLTDNSTFALRAKIDAMETNGLVRTLAEPNLVALSGDTASFLAGGEYPIPVVQSTSGAAPTTTIQYKDFGVGLSFTPTVTGTDQVNLAIASEVSALDPSSSVKTDNIDVPGLKVRRAKTTVEMRDGQTFAIAGLIQDDFQDTLNGIPGFANVPILGALFRSTDFTHNRSELVIFITVHLVQPVTKEQLAAPTDSVAPPSQADLDLMGDAANEKNAPAKQPAPKGAQEGYVLP